MIKFTKKDEPQKKPKAPRDTKSDQIDKTADAKKNDTQASVPDEKQSIKKNETLL